MVVRVVHWGTGNTGRPGLRGIIDHPDLELVGLYVHSAMDRDLFISYERFLPSWEKTGRWVLVVSSSRQAAN